MNPIVEEYLKKCANWAELKTRAEDQQYRERIVKEAGLYSGGWAEVDREYYNSNFVYDENTASKFKIEKDQDGVKHFYMMKPKVPIQVTDEELAAIEKTFTPEQLESFRHNPVVEKKEKQAVTTSTSGPYVFFIILGIIILIIGVFVSMSSASHSYSFEAMEFFTVFLTYLLYSCFCFCAASLFKELRTITDLLRSRKKYIHFLSLPCAGFFHAVMNLTFKEDSDLWSRRFSALKTLAESQVDVGLTSSASGRSRFLMAIHEHGAPIMRIPARPVIGPALGAPGTKAAMAAAVTEALDAAMQGDEAGVTAALEKSGEAGVDAIHAYIDAGVPPPNSPVTVSGGWIYNRVAKKGVPVGGKGFDKPLYATGALYNDFDYEVKPRS